MMKTMAILSILPFLFGCSFFDQSNSYGNRTKPRIHVNDRSQGVEMPLSMCDYVDGDFRLGGLRVAMYNGRCIVQTNGY